MTTKRYPIYIDIINFILILILATSVDMLISAGMGIYCTMYEIVAFMAIIVWSYMLREMVRWLLVYIPLNALMFALCAISSQPDVARVKVGIVVLLFILLNINYWIGNKTGTMDIHYCVVAIVAVAYIYCNQRGSEEYAGILYSLCICFVLLEMIKKLLENYRDIVISGQLTDDMPVREIFRNNTIGAVGVMLLVIMSMMFVKADGLIAWIKGLWFSIASRIGTLFHVENVVEEKVIEQRPIIDVVSPVPEKDGILAQILHIIELGLYAAAVALIIYGAVKLLIFIVKNLSVRDIEKREFRSFAGEHETREKIKRVEADDEEGFRLFKAPNEKIRNMYRKKLRSLKKSGTDIRETMTPRENSQSALKNSHDIAGATAMYEYVRYSANPVTSKEDVARFKQLIK